MTESPPPSTSKQDDDKSSEKPDGAVVSQIEDINRQVAQFRELLINIGSARDCPELREKIRRLRQTCVTTCKNTSQLILPQASRTTDIGIPDDCPNLKHLFYVIQLFLRELCKSKNLIRWVPMDMKDYYENRPGASNIGNVISQILLCKQITPDFQEEELCSIKKDSEEIRDLIDELQEFMPRSDGDAEKFAALQNAGGRTNGGGRRAPRIGSNPAAQSNFRGAFKFLCCSPRANYV